MKLSLKVLTTGKWEGKIVPITLSQFVIGRDAQCHMRPASPLISKRHCAIVRRENKAFLRDFGSTNGSFVNEKPVKGEIELKNDDVVKVGPIEFRVQLELPAPATVPVNQPAPKPVAKMPAAAPTDTSSGDEDTAGELLLSMLDDGPPPTPSGLADSVPEGSTVMELASVPPPGAEQPGGPKKDEKKKTPKETSSEAARVLLDKYMKGKR
jgi:pSer/pThr/pTyr-binding forkhead associated (FHA) protein